MAQLHRSITGDDATDTQLEFSLSCPVCLNTFTDPCFVCSNHHTLCRGCYSNINSRAAAGAAKCPQCREPMTRPMENSQMQGIINALVRLQPGACQEAVEDGSGCQRRPFRHCGHCDRRLCELHYSRDRLNFEAECQQQLQKAETAATESAAADVGRKSALDRIVDSCVAVLRDCQREIQQNLLTSAPTPKLRAEAAALRDALDGGDLKSAKASVAQLTELRERLQAQSGEPSEEDFLLAENLTIGNLATVAREIEQLRNSEPDRQRQILHHVRCFLDCSGSQDIYAYGAVDDDPYDPIGSYDL